MDAFAEELNILLTEAYHSILRIEEQMIRSAGKLDLTINEIHLIEAVARREGGQTISALSEELDISLPSVTVAINKLLGKGYVLKNRSKSDGRVVYVTLTHLGEKINLAHRYFHKKMVLAVAKELTDEEKAAMAKGIRRLNAFFEEKTEKEREPDGTEDFGHRQRLPGTDTDKRQADPVAGNQ